MRWKLFIVGGLIGSLIFQTFVAAAAQPQSLSVPFATQFDGSIFAPTDCGPASVAMAINYATGEHFTPLQARQQMIKLGAGYAANPESGTAIGDLARVARAHNVEAFMGDGAASTGWGPERIRNHLGLGHPVIVLTRIGYLPGYKEGIAVDHYVILTGATAAGYVYNDPALGNGKGRTISERQLQVAQRASSVPGQGAAFAGPPDAPKPAGVAVAVPNGPSVRITVNPGDTLSQLAERYGAKLDQVVALNRGSLRSVDHIEVGQVLNMPVPPAETVDPKAEAPKAETDAADAPKAETAKADAPKADATAPKADAAQTKSDAAAPKADAGKSKADAPKADTAQSKSDGATPKTDAAAPKPDAGKSNTNAAAPKTDAGKPGVRDGGFKLE